MTTTRWLAPAAPRTRRVAVILGLVSLLFVAGTLLNGCISTITPPSDPTEPCGVYLLREARHAGIVLPDPRGGFWEYGFGDWDWYALCRDRWYHVFDTMLWPTQGCLGRRRLTAEAVEDLGERGLVRRFEVERGRAVALLDKLGRRFDKNASNMIYNSAYGLHFVPDEQGFWFLFNCHDAVAEWIEELGCQVSWVPVRFGIELEETGDKSEGNSAAQKGLH